MTSDIQDRQRTPCLIFLHIPKAGGSTLNTIIQRQYPLGSVYTVTPARLEEHYRILRGITEERRRRIRVVSGHLPFGIHELLPEPAIYITLLRDPVDRIVSHYYFIRRSTKHRLHHQVRSADLDLRGYVTSGLTAELENGQARQLSGLTTIEPVRGSDVPEDVLYDRAMSNLDAHFAVAGLMERFDESLLLMKRRLNWKNVSYIRKNVTRERKPVTEVPEDIIGEIEARNRVDFRLYREMKERFERTIGEEGEHFQDELEELRQSNLTYIEQFTDRLRLYLNRISQNRRFGRA